MTVVTRVFVTPLPGKTAITQERVLQHVANVRRLGAHGRVAKILFGDLCGSFMLLGAREDMADVLRVSAALAQDPATIKLRQENETNPSATLVGPDVMRLAYGQLPATPLPAYLSRSYKVTRSNLANALALLPDIASVMGDNITVHAVVPMVSADMMAFNVVYRAATLEIIGATMDTTGQSEAFRQIVLKAAEFGTLVSSHIAINL